MDSFLYDTRLNRGLGLIDRTNTLLDVWEMGMSKYELNDLVLSKGIFSNISAISIKNIVLDAFAPRYLYQSGYPAYYLKQLKDKILYQELIQFYYLYTCRANLILRDFIQEVYWENHINRKTKVSYSEAKQFIKNAIENKKTSNKWSDSTINRIATYLIKSCSDFGLLSRDGKVEKEIQNFSICDRMIVYLVYDLHFAGLQDLSILENLDWKLFGLDIFQVKEELKRISMKGYFLYQSGGDLVQISWNYKTMDEVICAIIEREF